MTRNLLPWVVLAVTGCAAQPTGMQQADVGGTELHYTSTGRGETVVLVHGSLADLRYWQDAGQVAPLAARYRVIAYSRRYNHPNDNPATDNHSAVVEATDLAALLDLLSPEPVHLIGHSYGAYTALLFALAHPERVRSLVLAEPPLLPWLPDITGGAGIEEGFMAGVWVPLADAFAVGDAAGLDFTAKWYFGVPFAEVAPDWQVLFRDNVREWRALALSADPFPEVDQARVRALRVPVLLVSGARNAGGFNDLIDAHLLELLPTARRVVIDDAGHEMFQDAPERTAMAILEFLDTQRLR